MAKTSWDPTEGFYLSRPSDREIDPVLREVLAHMDSQMRDLIESFRIRRAGRQAYHFYEDTVTIPGTDVLMVGGLGANGFYHMPRNGHIIGVGLVTSVNLALGRVTCNPRINTVKETDFQVISDLPGLSTVIAGTAYYQKVLQFEWGKQAVSGIIHEGDVLDMVYTSVAGTTAHDMVVTVFVGFSGED